VEAVKRFYSGEGTGDSVDIRRNLVLNGLTALRQTYGLGVGGGADAYVHQRFGGVRDIISTHNIWVELLVNGGVILFVPFVVWYWSLVRELRKWHLRAKANRKLAYYCGALSLTLMTFLLSAVSASTVIYFLPMYLMFGLAISMVNICRHAAKTAKQPRQPAPRPQLTHIPQAA
jgi:teichuronic acid biosynthesis protein TuaE